jgi:hypothetical protein
MNWFELDLLKKSFLVHNTTLLLTQNPHPASSTQQAEQVSFTYEQIPKRASQFTLNINKR